jgi:hypothetical protein
MLVPAHKQKQLADIVGKLSVQESLALETMVYDKKAKAIETEENFRNVLQPLQKPMFFKGLLQRQGGIPPLHGMKNVAFLLLSSTRLAHTVVLGTYTSSAKDINPFVYIIEDTVNPALQDVLKCPIRYLPSSGYSITHGLKTLCQQDKIDALVLVSAPVFGAFLSGVRPSNKIIWWSMKYHDLVIPGIDDYISCNMPTVGPWKGPNGKTWWNTPGAVDKFLDDTATRNGRLLKETHFKDKLVLGVIGREEKINTDEYAAMVSMILSRYPEAIYVYTGRKAPSKLAAALQEFGDRAKYLGWVQTNLWSHVIDVYLDCFPFPSGHTFCEAALSGAAMVSLVNTTESKSSGIAQLAYDADTSAPGCATTLEGYFNEAVKVIDNPEARKYNADYWKRWVPPNIMNVPRFVEGFEQRVKELI